MPTQLHSLRKDKDFTQVFKTGRSSYGKYLGFKSVSNGLAISRFGIVIGAKISKKAVIRNKIKRQIRESIRSQLKNLKTGHDNVIIVLPLIINEKYQSIQKELEQHLKRLKLFK